MRGMHAIHLGIATADGVNHLPVAFLVAGSSVLETSRSESVQLTVLGVDVRDHARVAKALRAPRARIIVPRNLSAPHQHARCRFS